MQAGAFFINNYKRGRENLRTMGRRSPVDYDVYVYERLERGYGDAIFLRQAIIKRLHSYPYKRHILHIYKAAPLFIDIIGLEVRRIDGSNFRVRKALSTRYISEYGGVVKVFDLSKPCAMYESLHSPYITKSRHEIFCDELEVPYEDGGYEINFTDAEESFADSFLRGKDCCVGIHMWTGDGWRDYKRIPLLVERLAQKLGCWIITFDNKWRYSGRLKNIVSCTVSDIRKAWAVMGRMLFGVGPDSWGVHAWGALEIPVYGIFGPTDPAYRLKYTNAFASPRYKRCTRQYCWYTPCRSKLTGTALFPCLNARSSWFYCNDIVDKMGGFL